VLIVADDLLVGIVTERDLTAKVLAASLDPDVTRLEAVMTPDPDVLAPGDTPSNALELMRDRGFRHLPIVDKDEIVGIVSIRDLYAATKRQLEEDIRQRESFIFDTGYGAGA
jgi:CBS domain-containing protein